MFSQGTKSMKLMDFPHDFHEPKYYFGGIPAGLTPTQVYVGLPDHRLSNRLPLQ